MAQEWLQDDEAAIEDGRDEDRRADIRYQAVHWIGKLTSGVAQELCVVRNICSTALIAQVFSEHVPGDRVTVELKDGRSFDGLVVGCGDDTVEVQFDQPIDLDTAVAPEAAAETGGNGAAAPRMPVSCGGTLQLGLETFAVEIRDLSQGGAKVETAALPKLGEPVALEIEGLGQLEGTVRWCENGHVGIAFAEPLAFDEMTGWIVARERSADGSTSRRWPRYNMFLKSWIQLSGVLTPVEIYIHNLGRGGLMATCRRGLHAGEQVVVGLGRAGEIEGSVVWTDSQHAGISFLRMLDPEHARQPFANRSVPPILHHTADGRRPGLKSH